MGRYLLERSVIVFLASTGNWSSRGRLAFRILSFSVEYDDGKADSKSCEAAPGRSEMESEAVTHYQNISSCCTDGLADPRERRKGSMVMSERSQTMNP